MDDEQRVAAIRERAEAATPGPWHWAGNTDSKNIYLATWLKGLGRCIVMDFTRWGMQNARPRFSDDLMMVKADTMVTYEVAPEATSRDDPKVYRADISGIRHPDAVLIEHSKADIEFLLHRLHATEARAAEAEKVLLGGLGKPWSRVVDDAVRALRGVEQ